MSDEHMSDKDMDAMLREWTQGAPAGRPDRSRVVGNVVGRLGSTRRRQRRWWLLRSIDRKPDEPAATDKTRYQPSPIPATNGHTPTVIGRTQSMLSPVKAITAGVIVAAVGGAFLIAQPFQQQEGVPSAAESAALAEPVEFTAVFTPSSRVRCGTYETVEGVEQQRGSAWTPVMSGVSDRRLDGTLTYSEDYDRYPGGYQLATATYRIANDGGAWQGSTPIIKQDADYTDNSVVLLVGEGAYDGLYAWMDTSDWSAISGVVFPAPPPEAPIPPELP